MKRNAIVRVVLFSILAISLTIALIGGISTKFFHDQHSLSVQERIELPEVAPMEVAPPDVELPVLNSENFSAKDIQSLEISWVSGKMTIEAMDTDTITIAEEASGSQRSMMVKKSGSKLIVECCEDSSPVFFNVGGLVDKNLYITVPLDWECEELAIEAASADAMVTALTARKVEVDTASGAYVFRDCQVDSLDMDTASGGLEFTGTLNELDLDSASAGAKLTLSNQPKSIQMDSASGDLNLTLPEDCGFTVMLDTLSGSCSAEQDTVKRDEKLIHGDGACKIEVDGLSSSVHIRKAA